MDTAYQKAWERVNKLEALAKSTTSRAESESALKKAENIRKKYGLEKKDRPSEFKNNENTTQAQTENPSKIWLNKKFQVNGIKEKRFEELIKIINSITTIPQAAESEIRWTAEIFIFPFLYFFKKKRVVLHIEFLSTCPWTLNKLIKTFMAKSGLEKI